MPYGAAFRSKVYFNRLFKLRNKPNTYARGSYRISSLWLSLKSSKVCFWPLAASYRRQRGEDRGQVKQPFPVAISDQSQQILAAGLSEI